MRVLALDYGTARCGCAISDPTGTLVTPLAPVEPPDANQIAELASSREVDRVVVGLPVTLSGEEGQQARLTRAFAAELGELLQVPVETHDERLTTRMAARSVREGALAHEDSIAAAHLLESYLAATATTQGEGEEAPPGAPGRASRPEGGEDPGSPEEVPPDDAP